MLSQRIKNLRNEEKLSQSHLASLCCVSQQAVAKWEKGICAPDPDKLLKLCDIFGVCAEYLLGSTANRSITLSLLNDDDAISCLSLVHARPELKTLIKETQHASKEEINKAILILRALFSKEQSLT